LNATAQPSTAIRLRQRILAREDRILPIGSFLVFLILWEVTADAGLLNKLFFASPSAIVSAGFSDIRSSTFWGDFGTSVSEFISGYALALTAGFAFGVLMGWFRRLEYFFEPWVDALNATPTLALMPLVLIWFGLGTTSKVAIVFVTTFVPVVLNVYTGVRTVDPRLLHVARSFGSSRTYLLRTVVIPSIAPFGFLAARIAVGRAVSGVSVGEFFGADSGLIFRIFQDAQVLATADLLFLALTVTFLALAAFKFVGFAEHRVLRWRFIASGEE
jgi:NitT/TauT family transport system permease protein